MAQWTASDIPPLNGKTVIVTGTGGIGYETALALAAAGAAVVLAGRNPRKGVAALERITAAIPSARVYFEELDLASLASIEGFANRLSSSAQRVDILINNAGVMTPPQRQATQDGFELQFGTNYLGHFALTARLLPLLRCAREPRVIALSSIAARDGHIDFDDLNCQRNYHPMQAYGQSKLACLIFSRELQRRSDAHGWGLASIAAHPGVSRTDLLPNGAGPSSMAGRMRRYAWFLFQPAAQGALPSLFAATSPHAAPGGYYGPHRLSETRGYPVPAKVPQAAQDRFAAAQLWDVSEELTGLRYTSLAEMTLPATAAD